MHFLGLSDRKILSKKETIVWAKLHGKTHTFAIKSKAVPAVLKIMDDKGYFTEQLAMEDAVGVLDRGEYHGHGKEFATMYAAHCLLWAACRCPKGELAEKEARKGGSGIGWEISKPDSEGGFTYGLHVGDLKQQYIPLPPAGHA